MRLCSIIISFVIVMCTICTVQAQEDIIKTKNANESLRIAQGLVNKGKFEKAKRQINHTIKIKANFAVAYRILGKINFELAAYQEAIDAFEKSFQLDDKISRAAYFECAKSYLRLYLVDLAEFHVMKYEEMKGKRYTNAKMESALEVIYDAELDQVKANIAYLKTIDFSKQLAKPVHLGKNLNTEFDEYLPTITSNGSYMVFTRKHNNEDENIMFSSQRKDNWEEARPMNSRINSEFNEGMAKFRTDGKAFYFSGCNRPGALGGCDLYLAVLEQGDVHHVQRMDGAINSNAWDSQPSISCDGTQMFFTSTREGGFGGSDLWMSFLLPSGEWSNAENLGPEINTAGDEEAPFIATDGVTLYFSSNGHPGQGDEDIFMTKRISENKWMAPTNLGFPINSPCKEIGFYVKGDSKTAFFASSRPGGEGMLDLYQVELPLHLRPDEMVHIEGFVYDQTSQEPVSTKVKIIRSYDNFEITTDDDGKFFTCLSGNKGYSFQIDAKGYKYFVQANFLAAQDNELPLLVKIPLNPIENKIVSRGPAPAKPKKETEERRVQFFFGFDSHELKDETIIDLEELSKIILLDPDWQIEVIGYADNVGEVAYNKKLSEQRAANIVNYLVDAGIPASKVIKKEGRGSDLELNVEENRKLSRRVDVVIKK